MNKSLETYFAKHYKFSTEDGALLGRWDFQRILQDSHYWGSHPRWLILYAILFRDSALSDEEDQVNGGDPKTKRIYVGCTEHYQSMMGRHKTDLKEFDLLLKVKIPPVRNFSTKHLKRLGRPRGLKDHAILEPVVDTKSRRKKTVPVSNSRYTHKTLEKEWRSALRKIMEECISHGLSCELSRGLVKRDSPLYSHQMRTFYKENRNFIHLFQV